jgi:hypothetical protein
MLESLEFEGKRLAALVDPVALAKERAQLALRKQALKDRLTLCSGMLGDSASLNGVAAAAHVGVSAMVNATVSLGVAGLVGEEVSDSQLELGEELAAALEQLGVAAQAVFEKPDELSVWKNLLAAAQRVGEAALAFVQGNSSLEGGYRAVSKALQHLMNSIQQRQKLLQENSANKFEENREEIMEQRAKCHRLNKQLLRKRLSTENLMKSLAATF